MYVDVTHGNDRNFTKFGAANCEFGYGEKIDSKYMITMTTQMEISWVQSSREGQGTSSSESLVHAKQQAP